MQFPQPFRTLRSARAAAAQDALHNQYRSVGGRPLGRDSDEELEPKNWFGAFSWLVAAGGYAALLGLSLANPAWLAASPVNPGAGLFFLLGAVAAWMGLGLFVVQAKESLYNQPIMSRLIDALGWLVAIGAVAAIASLPFSADLKGDGGFVWGGLVGSFITHYRALGLPWYVGGMPGAGALLGSVAILGLTLGTRRVREWLWYQAYYMYSGLEPPSRDERKRPKPHLLETDTGGRSYTLPKQPQAKPRSASGLFRRPEAASLSNATAQPKAPDAKVAARPAPAATTSNGAPSVSPAELLANLKRAQQRVAEERARERAKASPSQPQSARMTPPNPVAAPRTQGTDSSAGRRAASTVAALGKMKALIADAPANKPASPTASSVARPAAYAAPEEVVVSSPKAEKEVPLPVGKISNQTFKAPTASPTKKADPSASELPAFDDPSDFLMFSQEEITREEPKDHTSKSTRSGAPDFGQKKKSSAISSTIRSIFDSKPNHEEAKEANGASEESSSDSAARIVSLKAGAGHRPTVAPEEPVIEKLERFAPQDWFDNYEPPPLALLEEEENPPVLRSDEELITQARELETALADFGVEARVGEVVQGPVVTLFELNLSRGTKVSKVAALEDDLAIVLKAQRVRVLAPIPGKSAVGIEVPNPERSSVRLRELMSSNDFWRNPAPLLFALGVQIDGTPHYEDLSRLPHLLIAGATGSGKSVMLNSIISSILFHMAPTMVRMLLIDPKRVELSIYDEIPHLLSPVISEPDQAAEALQWVVDLMEERCERLQEMRVRNIAKYNEIALGRRPVSSRLKRKKRPPYLPHIVVVIDELADLMLQQRSEVETSLVRLAQKARATGIHLIVATQRPSVDVITGLIRSNFPSRIAFQVSSKTDSRIILDANGAECLLGRGDMLFSPGGALKPQRMQGAFVSEEDVEALVDFLRERGRPYYMREDFTPSQGEEGAADANIRDDLYFEALRAVVDKGQATQSALTSRLSIGRTNAGRILDRMEREGLVERAGRSRTIHDDARKLVERLEDERRQANRDHNSRTG